MKVADKLTIIHPDDNNKYISLKRDNIKGDIRANSSSVKFSISLTPSWEKNGMQIVCSKRNGNIICTGLVKEIIKLEKRNKPIRRKYKLIKDGSNVMGLNP